MRMGGGGAGGDYHHEVILEVGPQIQIWGPTPGIPSISLFPW
jgi:hypothetical protein